MNEELAETLLGAYALDAVDPDERREIEEVLERSPRLRAEADSFKETAALLAYTGEDAPPAIWDRIAGEIEGATPPRLDLPGVDPEPESQSAQVLLFTRRPALMALVGAVAAAVLLIAGFAAANRDDSGAPDTELASVMRDAADRALADPRARVAHLEGDRGEAVAAVLPDGTGFLIGDDLPALDADRSYQLWGLASGNVVISLGVIGNEPDVVAFTADPRVTLLMLTDEVAGGVATSKQTPRYTGSL